MEDTPTTHRDYEDLKEVYRKVKNIVKQINDRTKQVENIEGLSKLQEKYKLSEIGIDIISRDRWIVQDLKVIVAKNGKSFKGQSTLLLFNDEVMLLREDNDLHAVLCRIPLTLVDYSDSKKSDNEISLVGVLSPFN